MDQRRRCHPCVRMRAAGWTPRVCAHRPARGGGDPTEAGLWAGGRKGDETIVAGRAIAAMDIWRVLEQVPETAAAVFQLVRPAREMDELRIRVGYDPGVTASVQDVRDRVSAAITVAPGGDPVVELLPQSELLARC